MSNVGEWRVGSTRNARSGWRFDGVVFFRAVFIGVYRSAKFCAILPGCWPSY